MNKRISSLIAGFILIALILTACNYPLASMAQVPEIVEEKEAESNETQVEAEMSAPESEEMATLPPTPEETPVETETPTETSDETDLENQKSETQAAPVTLGPDNFPEGINPLTGLPVADPELLTLPPAMVSVSNFPASARPQAGLNTSPIIYELYIGEGMTRFLVLFYGQFPSAVSGQTEGQTAGDGATAGDTTADSGGIGDAASADAATVGPIRSGRLPYEDIRSIYSGFLVMASAYSGIAVNLSQATTIYGSDSDDINSAMIGVDQLQGIAQSHAEGYPGSNFSLDGMTFSTTPPEGGQTADKAWVFYSSLNQIQWVYDESLGAYIRYDIKTDGSGEFVMATDRLTGEPVSRENMIVIFANHDFLAPTLIDVHLTNMPPMKALLFRDGEVHEIFWTTQYGEYEQETGLLRPMRFVDADGNPVALKPGYTWIEVVSTASFYAESVISDYPFTPIKEQEGSGLWLVRFKGTY
jgi:hypothetical protein